MMRCPSGSNGTHILYPRTDTLDKRIRVPLATTGSHLCLSYPRDPSTASVYASHVTPAMTNAAVGGGRHYGTGVGLRRLTKLQTSSAMNQDPRKRKRAYSPSTPYKKPGAPNSRQVLSLAGRTPCPSALSSPRSVDGQRQR